MLRLRNATVVDATGSRRADVAVEGGEIVSVGSSLPEPDGESEERDLDGQYLAPGLVDAHVHLGLDGRADPSTLRDDSRSTTAYRAASNLRDALEAGVTTVRDLGAPGSVAVDAARAVEDGLLTGPRVVAAGQNVCMTGGHGHWFGREADGEAEVRKAVREQLRTGADVVKCMATGGVLTEGADIGAPELLEDELEALVETANAKGRPTAAHAHGAEGLKNAVRAGITSIEHGTFMDREAARLMAERNTYWVPTAKALHGIVEADPDADVPEWAVEKAEEATEAFERSWEYALDEGVTVAMGTDAGTPFNFHADAAEELELMVDYGLDAADAVRAATVNAADLLGLDDVGRVEEGYRADLVVLPENPLENVRAYQQPELVVAEGEVVA